METSSLISKFMFPPYAIKLNTEHEHLGPATVVIKVTVARNGLFAGCKPCWSVILDPKFFWFGTTIRRVMDEFVPLSAYADGA